MSKKQPAIAFTTDDMVSAKKDFEGTIVVSEYIENARFGGKQLHIEIRTEDYDKNQHEVFEADFIPLDEYVRGYLSGVIDRFGDEDWKDLEDIHVLMGTLNGGEGLETCKWFNPSDKLLTKWAHFIDALTKTGAIREVDWSGESADEQMTNFADSLKGMTFRFVEYTDLQSVAKSKETGKFTIEAILPVEFKGRSEVGEISIESIKGEVTL